MATTSELADILISIAEIKGRNRATIQGVGNQALNIIEPGQTSRIQFFGGQPINQTVVRFR